MMACASNRKVPAHCHFSSGKYDNKQIRNDKSPFFLSQNFLCIRSKDSIHSFITRITLAFRPSLPAWPTGERYILFVTYIGSLHPSCTSILCYFPRSLLYICLPLVDSTYSMVCLLNLGTPNSLSTVSFPGPIFFRSSFLSL